MSLSSTSVSISEDTQAALLLCCSLGQRDDSLKPLTTRQYSALTAWLAERSLRPADLLQNDAAAGAQVGEISADTIARLLARGAALALVVERWSSRGIWIVGRQDRLYPARYTPYLQKTAPALLFGVGDASLLQRGGLAVVGSRHASEEDLEFARKLGRSCAAQEVVAISGAAKGVDSESMMAAIDDGGYAVGVLADGLGRSATVGPYFDAIVNGRLTLVSPYEPESRWFPYTAMERNKLIYALADAAVVVSSAAEEGGTWAGATEALKRALVPVYVKSTGEIAPGNRKLLQIGAREFPEDGFGDLSQLFGSPAKTAPLFEQASLMEAPPGTEAESQEAPTTEAGTEPTSTPSQEDNYPRMIAALEQPLDAKSLAAVLHVSAAQIRIWLKRAVEEGRVRKLNKPVRYVVTTETGTLFAEDAKSNQH